MKFLFCLAIFLASTDFSLQAGDDWWKHTIVYQVYPRSFQDSNGDGTGDLTGIENRLGYFIELGVETIWLSPIFKSPMKDFGYDISDFKDIDPTFGTLEDFKSMITTAHDYELKIVLDFVPNHSSDEHEWFKKSIAREDPYTNYYTWLDPKGLDEDNNPIPPNNWISVFRGSAWTYVEERGQFYLHQFLPGQPDLNFRDPEMVVEMLDVIAFWLDLGVDGFRMDAVFHIWEDEQFLDEPISGNTDDPNDYGYLNHIYTTNLNETRGILKQFHDLIKSYGAIDGHDRVNMLEIYLSPEEILPYYEVSDYPFNFAFIGLLGDLDAQRILYSINEWLDNLPEGRVANWVLGNHDNWRIASRTHPELIDALNMLTLTLPGVTVTYYGEELGMNNTKISYEDTVDPSGCNCGPDHYADLGCSRDPERTPMQWNGMETSAGFSTTDETWLPVNPNYYEINVDTQQADPHSHLQFYKQLVQLRYRDPAFEIGAFKGSSQGNVLAFSRQAINSFYATYVTLINFDDSNSTVNFSGIFSDSVDTGSVLLSSLGMNSDHPSGSAVDLGKLTLGPYEGLLVYLQAQ